MQEQLQTPLQEIQDQFNYNFLTMWNDVPIGSHKEIELNDMELIVYLILQKDYSTVKMRGLTSISAIMDYMYIKTDNTRYTNKIKLAINSLIEKKLIIATFNVHLDVISFKDIKPSQVFYYGLRLPCSDNKDNKNEWYFTIKEEYLNTILKYLDKNNKIEKASFIRYFLCALRVVHCDAEFGWLTQDSVSFVSNKTITQYNKIIQELELLRYCNDYVTPNYRYCSTYFGLYHTDKDYNAEEHFNNMLEQQKQEKGLKDKHDKKASNENRSDKQTLNNINKKLEIVEDNEEKEKLEKQKQHIEEKRAELTDKVVNITKNNKKGLTNPPPFTDPFNTFSTKTQKEKETEVKKLMAQGCGYHELTPPQRDIYDAMQISLDLGLELDEDTEDLPF